MDIASGNIFPHHDYNPATMANDVGLIKLPYAIRLPRRPSDICWFLYLDKDSLEAKYTIFV